jgi:putative membrane protein
MPWPSRRSIVVWCAIFAVVLVWSFVDPKDRLTWWLESAPALIAVVILAATLRRFPLTPLVYWLILVHSIVLMIGGHYTYAEVPLFDWLKEPLGWTRNNYDKVGHFVQGFVPALIARELLLRHTRLEPGGWLNVIVVSVCLAISALYELIEWQVAVSTGEAADAFLGTQGDVWDTQKDMATALIGAIVAVATLASVHDRELAALRSKMGSGARET